MLLAAGIKNSTNIIINGFVTAEGGVKMSKSLGNVVSPIDLAAEFGADALRCFVLKDISSFEDTPFSIEKFKESYNANLANGIGNQTSRILKLTSQYLNLDDIKEIMIESEKENLENKYSEYFESLNNFDLNKAINFVFEKSRKLDEYIQLEAPFKLLKEKPELSEAENLENKINLLSIWNKFMI
jgi:methionyl-tRNA synthetase